MLRILLNICRALTIHDIAGFIILFIFIGCLAELILGGMHNASGLHDNDRI